MSSNSVLVMSTSAGPTSPYSTNVWPDGGLVEDLDFSPYDIAQCYNCLHGLIWGEGESSRLDFSPDVHWIITRVVATKKNFQDLGLGYCSFGRGYVVHVGNQASATGYLASHGGKGRRIVGAMVEVVGDSRIAVAGDRGKATAFGCGCNAITGAFGISTTGKYGMSWSGYDGKAVSGYGGIAMAGNFGIAEVGDAGRAQAGVGGVVSGGIGSVLMLGFDSKDIRIGYTGNDLQPNTPYILDSAGNFVKFQETG